MYNLAVPRQKYYVVWRGRKTGVFGSWEACQAQVKGYAGAAYQAFGSRLQAEQALRSGPPAAGTKLAARQDWLLAVSKPVLPSIAVDAACSGAPGPVEYQGVETQTGRGIFHEGPYADGTNNVGEFLAIVQALEWLDASGLDWPVYSDSANAISWVKAGRCRTQLRRLPSNRRLFALIARAEESLRQRKPRRVLKWDTPAWGENPADFGRK
jgi:ribonuclease HI